MHALEFPSYADIASEFFELVADGECDVFVLQIQILLQFVAALLHLKYTEKLFLLIGQCLRFGIGGVSRAV